MTHALYARFLRGLELSPGGEAIRAGGRSVTYTEAHETALLWAGAVVAAKPRAVGVLAGREVDDYIGFLAGLYSGVPVVPLHPDFPAARTRQMLEAAGVELVIAGEGAAASLDRLQQSGEPVPVLLPASGRALAAPRPVEPSDVAYVLFTSGSTGTPKGVPVTHANTAHYFGLLDKRYDFGPADVFSQTFDLNFDCAMFDLFCAWGAGATLVHVPLQAYRELPEFLHDNGVTVWFSTPSAVALVRRLGGLRPAGFPGLRWAFFAGEAFRSEDAREWQAAAPSALVENLYGPTEITITVTGHRWTGGHSERLGVNGTVPIGQVHEGHEHLLTDEDGRPAAAEGELLISGPQVAAGYLDPAQDEGRFVELGGRRWYRTGDRIRRVDGGELVYLGRLDSQVQVHGIRLELAEVDHAMAQCRGVTQAATVLAGNDLVVFYTGTEGSAVEFVRTLRALLPAGVIPLHYHHCDELPLNSNRKIDRRALMARVESIS